MFTDRPNDDDFATQIAIALKTGNTNDVIESIRNCFKIDGLGYNIIPSTRTIRSHSSTLMSNFISVCDPELTFSGFRCDLVKTVKYAAYLLFRIEDLENVEIDIWGDGCEIGGVDITRLCFRFLRDVSDSVTCQSASVTFCFCGKLKFYLLKLTL